MSAAAPAAATPVPAKTWFAIVGASLGAFMALLNTQLVGASLNDIQGALGASAGDKPWISTSYLVAEIVVLPMAAWFANVFSVRRYLIANAALFLMFSLACGFAQTFGQMIVLRILQGLSGGVLIPLAFMLIMTRLPPSRRPVGLAVFSIAATFAPAIGPAVGGWLADHWGWRYGFYVNLLPGLATLAMLWVSLERQPMRLDLLRQGDWPGIATMTVGLAALQVVLEEGAREDWFDSPFILRLALVAATSLVLFVWIELGARHPLLNLRLLGRRNFGAGVLAMLLIGLALYSSLAILPLYLANHQNYSAGQIGWVLAWTGLPQLVVIPLVPLLMKFLSARLLVATGLALLALSNFMNAGLNMDVAADQLLLPNIVRACGQALLLTPLAALATAGIAAEDAGSASGLLNVARNLGGAIGIALLQTVVSNRQSFHVDVLSRSVSLFDETTRQGIDDLVYRFLEAGTVDPAAAWHKAIAVVIARIDQQAAVMAFGDAFHLLGLAVVAALMIALLLEKSTTSGAGAVD